MLQEKFKLFPQRWNSSAPSAIKTNFHLNEVKRQSAKASCSAKMENRPFQLSKPHCAQKCQKEKGFSRATYFWLRYMERGSSIIKTMKRSLQMPDFR